MYKIVLDSDGLIKLIKSGLMEKISDIVLCTITIDVYNETVSSGKERLYEDAYIIEDLIERKKIKIVNMKAETGEFGKGEMSTLEAYKKGRFSVIISDDRKFLKFLKKESVPFATPANLIVSMFKMKKLSRNNALDGLENMCDIISHKSYNKSIDYIRR